MSLPTYVFGTIQTKAYRILREHVCTVLNQYDMTPAAWSALGIIRQAKNGIQQATIAKTMHVKAPLVTVIIKQLQAKSIVSSVRNQQDGRAKSLAVTEEGQLFIDKVEAELQSALLPLLEGVDKKELMAYKKVLETIIKNDISPKKLLS